MGLGIRSTKGRDLSASRVDDYGSREWLTAELRRSAL